ncbi:MAG: hypothetical protein LAT81_16685 [Oceanicaulis sp.]|jgi:hypothetical protein|nr:hypothetical protein [Oceanicaulis sp.]
MTCRLSVLAALLPASLALSACGGADSEPDNSGAGGSATASWEGEALTLERVRCRALPGGEEWTITASGPQTDIQVRYWRDGDGGYDTSEASVRLELMDDNWRVLERYAAQGAALDSAQEDRASGEIHLMPHHDSGVGEVRPDGGTLRFDITC